MPPLHTDSKDGLNLCIACEKVRTSSKDKICAACSNKGRGVLKQTDSSFDELIDELFKSYKVHDRNLNACLNDAVAVHYIKTTIKTLIADKIIGSHQDDTNSLISVYATTQNQLRDSQRKALFGKEK